MQKSELDYFTAEKGSGVLPCYHDNSNQDIFNFVTEASGEIDQVIKENGGLLLRNFSIRSVSEFNQLANQLTPNLLDYVYRSTPRTRLGGKIYTATEYPPSRSIPLHNENSYTLKWPSRILFFCVVAAQSGGETPLADSRCVYNKIRGDLSQKFNEKKVKYVRNYAPGIDLSWQTVFQTEDKLAVEQYCQDNQINFEWHDFPNDCFELTTWQICQASLLHPDLNLPVWFNQAHLFHSSALEEEDKILLRTYLERDALPRQSYFGDGSEIQENEINEIINVYHDEKIIFSWQRGDVLILDNLLMAHGRNPYVGDRKVVVAMIE